MPIRSRHATLLLCWLFSLASPLVAAQGIFDPVTNQYTSTVAVVGNNTHRNSIVEIDRTRPVTADGGPPTQLYDFYDAASGQLFVSSVVVGGVLFTNVRVFIRKVISPGVISPVLATPLVFATRNPLPAAMVGRQYQQSVVGNIFPESRYTYMIDSLASGSLPTGMTIDMDGVLSGKPFATGRADVQGVQLPNTYTFGVCAVDTITRFSTSPCPQTTIIVNPATFTISKTVVGAGDVSASLSGPAYPQGTKVTLTAVPSANSSFDSWSGACSTASTTCSLTMTSNQSVTATFKTAAATLPASSNWTGTWNWKGAGAFDCQFNDAGTLAVTLVKSGSSYSGSNVSGNGIEFRQEGSCALLEMLSGNGGSMSLTPNGSSWTLTWSLLALSFTGTATLTGTTLTGTFVRDTGGSGSFVLNLVN